MKGKVQTFSSEWKENVDHIQQQQDLKLDSQEFTIKLLTGIVINQDEKIKMLEKRVTVAYQHELKPNMLIYGLIEKNEESSKDLFTIVKSFFKDKMEIEQVIEVMDAFCLGLG